MTAEPKGTKRMDNAVFTRMHGENDERILIFEFMPDEEIEKELFSHSLRLTSTTHVRKVTWRDTFLDEINEYAKTHKVRCQIKGADIKVPANWQKVYSKTGNWYGTYLVR
jgi:hypothetical protein